MSSELLHRDTEESTRTIIIGGQPWTHEEFYQEFVVSASGFVAPEIQERLRYSKMLIAGVGSIGNPIAMMLARSGAENITVMDPGDIEVSNCSRQQYNLNQVNENKADATVANILSFNPFPTESVKGVSEGLTLANVAEYVRDSDIIIDGVDIRALDVIYALHEQACIQRKPVLVGYDLAGTAMIAVYRYDLEKNIKPLRGELSKEKIMEFSRVQRAYEAGNISEAKLLDYIYDAFTGPIKPLQVPVEQLEEIIGRKETDNRTYQMGTTATQLSALAVETIKEILAGKQVRDTILVDLPSEVRKSSRNPNILNKITLLLRALLVLSKRGKSVKETLDSI